MSPQAETHAIIETVCKAHGQPVGAIMRQDRSWPVQAARRHAIEAVWMLRPHLTSTHLGQIFHRDHTTILYALGRLKRAQG